MSAQTLAQEIEHAAVGFAELEKEYRPMLKLVKELIGVIPNCDPVLEIWPTGFRSYNLLVPNLLNLPGSILGQGAPKDLVGLAMYLSSRAAECMYCSAHTCSFALRRGASPDAIVGNYSAAEAAVAAVAEGMGRVPADLTKSQITDLEKHLHDKEIEWVILGVALMGFLNKFMDTMGIELEADAIGDVEDLIADTGWTPGKHSWSVEDVDGLDEVEGRPLRPTANRKPAPDRNDQTTPGSSGHAAVPQDSLGTYLRVMRQVPGAARRDRAWSKGISGRAGVALLTLEDQFGHAYGTLANLEHNKPVRAITAVLRDNLDPEKTEVGIGAKCLVALVYARVVGSETLTAEAVQMTQRLAPEISHQTLTAVGRFATADLGSATIPSGLSSIEAAVVMMARVGSPSPSEVNRITIDMASSALSPAQIVETVVWLSIQQLLHRLYVFFEARQGSDL